MRGAVLIFSLLLYLLVDGAMCSDVGAVEGDEGVKNEEGSLPQDANELRRMVIRHMNGENTVSRLQELGFVIEDTQEELSYVVRGGSDSAIQQLRREGARVAHRPTSVGNDHERLLEKKRSDARQARIQLHEDKHRSTREARILSEVGKAKQVRRKQWKTPTNKEDTSRRSGASKRKRHAPMSENATLKKHANTQRSSRDTGDRARTIDRTRGVSGTFSHKKRLLPLRKSNIATLTTERREKLSSMDRKVVDGTHSLDTLEEVQIGGDSATAGE